MDILKLVIQNIIKLFLSLIVIIILVVSGTKIYNSIKDENPVEREIAREEASSNSSLVNVNTVRANIVNSVSTTRTNNSRIISKTGNIVAGKEVAVSPEVSARVAEVFVREGSRVKKDDVLLKLENSTQLRNAVVSYNSAIELLRNAENSLNLAAMSGNLNVSTFQEQMDLARLNIEKAAVQLESTQAIRFQQLNLQDINSATQDLQSRLPQPSNPVNELLQGAGQGLSKLLEDNGINTTQQNQLSESEIEYLKEAIENNQNEALFRTRELELLQGNVQDDQNLLNLQSSEVQLSLLAKQMQAAELQSQNGVNSARAQLIQIKQQIESAKITLELGEIRSPIDGYVANLSTVVGSQVSPGQPILSVVNLEEVTVKLFLSANEVLELIQTPSRNQKVIVEVLGEQVPANIKYIGVVANSQTRTIPVEVVPSINSQSTKSKFIPNTFARINFELEKELSTDVKESFKESFSVPISAVIMNGNDFTLAVVENGLIKFKKVEIAAGVENGKLFIKSGINNGDVVVLNPLGLNEGDKVSNS